MSFTKEALKSLKQSGTITPSSKYLIRKMLKPIDFEKANVILELGLGDGCITKELIALRRPETTIIGLEINDFFYAECKYAFSGDANVYVEKDSAEDIDEVLKRHAIERVDYIVSSLPLTLFNPTLLDSIFEKVKTALKPDGTFIQYQYSLSKYRMLNQIFGSVKVSFTAKNIPPAFIFTCKL